MCGSMASSVVRPVLDLDQGRGLPPAVTGVISDERTISILILRITN